MIDGAIERVAGTGGGIKSLGAWTLNRAGTSIFLGVYHI